MPISLSDAVETVDSALHSLNFCAVRASDHLREWFVPIFNWYCQRPNPRRYSFATILDYGLLLVEPAVGFRELPVEAGLAPHRFHQYQAFLRKLRDRPLMQRAQRIWQTACHSDRPGVSDEVGRLLLDALTEQLSSGCPAEEHFHRVNQGQIAWTEAEQKHFGECPRCRQAEDARLKLGTNWTGLTEERLPPASLQVALLPGGKVSVFSPGVSGSRDLQIPGINPTLPYPAFWFPPDPDAVEVPGLLRLFMAHVACYQPEAKAHLDRPVVEACLAARPERESEHRPPKLDDRVLEARAKSRLPGAIAGVTRVETKTELDPWQRILPSEWMVYKWNPEVGRETVFLGKPLIYKLEREQDQVPKHRALVCFLLESSDSDAADEGEGAEDAVTYVLARRQAFDLLRDLRVSVELLRNHAQVEIDIAIFVLSAYGADAELHRLFRLDRLDVPTTPDERLNRFDQLISVGALAEGFFSKKSAYAEPTLELAGSAGSQEIIDPQLDRFLQRQPQREAAYHGQYLVPIGSLERLLDLVPVTIPEPPIAANVRRGVLLLKVAPSAPGEPQWSYRQTRSFREAAHLLAEPLTPANPDELRRAFLQMVLGDREKQRAQQRFANSDGEESKRNGQL
jgi:hypothetical protein